ncbi:Zn(2)-C6 fungal-type DNA-binding domain protein [Metarhizium robertsii ARSEF 23]|uniref:Zn(2)-C6 fungal-type DNA-binding domain protein n=1 Tax=Metarhizium robertsii (strain ARSEF 23 / ATCC MYA-3075) TaxID=655844 RepID=E9ETE2_METRA|nr:Zn(2)-C6 fungal-type DNA-binding domain protein [Metarhizium robertsii ARSEF 23]EFZ00695.1 Zn(2)-C6 fungal-type DNA-binding domain protein [Metarhizium robertsii ARSEF 23]
MAGPGGGPPRRSHTKSRKGCETCKRRHIRCDENFPQCRNCTKHKIRCPYNDVQVPDADRSTTPDKPNLMWTPQVEAAIAEWQATGVFPFSTLHVYSAPMPHLYSLEDLRLIYHVANLYDQLSVIDGNNFTLWTRHIPTLLNIGATTPYVMHALLAFSAMHIAFLTDCPLVGSLAFEHRGIALSGLHEAIGTFSRETSDAILAASLVLSWQATDWRSWTQLMQGTSTVIDAMDAWKHESQFGDFIAEVSTFPTAPPSPGPDHRPTQPRDEDIQAFQRTLEQVQKVELHLKHHKEATTQVQHLIGFLKGSRKISPTLSIAQQYERLQPLRTWLFWMPVEYLQNYQGSANSLIVIAHLYTVALLMERLFPEIGAAYFGSLSISPIEEIARRLMSLSVAGGSEGGVHRETPLTLMEFPINTVGEFRSRMGWVHPERTPSFPQFHPPNFPVPEEYSMPPGAAPSPHYMYSNVAFSYSAEEMPMLNSASMPGNQGHSASPLVLSSPFSSQQYLNVPSPSYAAGAYSPASSTFEGSVTYSDTEEYGSYDMRGSAPAYLTSGQPSMYNEAHSSYGLGHSVTTTPTYPPPDDPAVFAAGLSAAPSPFLNAEQFGMLPMPESPVLSHSTPHLRHRHTASMSSGPHPPSPLAQAPLVPPPDMPNNTQVKGKGPAYHGQGPVQ